MHASYDYIKTGSATPIGFGQPSLSPLPSTTPSVLPPFINTPSTMQGRTKPILTPSYGVNLSEYFNLSLVYGTIFIYMVIIINSN